MPRTHRILLRFLCLAAICILSLVVPSIAYKHSLPPTAASYGTDLHLTSSLNSVVSEAVRNRDAKRGSGLLINANSGEIIAATSVTASTEERNTTDMNTESAWEPGSVMKPLLVAAAINETSVNLRSTSFPNDATYIDDYHVSNAIPYTKNHFTMQDIINNSINTGAVKVLKSLSKHDTIDMQSRSLWYDYLKNHYRFGRPTGINKPYEDAGYVAPPDVGSDINFLYGNMAIGQGMTVTPLQLASAYAAILNGGTYYQPYIDNSTDHTPITLGQGVVSPKTSKTMRQVLQTAYAANWPNQQSPGLTTGGKSGTAHVVGLSGQYDTLRDNGTYIGYISHGPQTMILLIRLDEPATQTFASHEAAGAWIKFVHIAANQLATYPQ